jgi:hypothetical protein
VTPLVSSDKPTTIRQQGRPSLTRILLGVATCGLSLHWTGVRVVRKTTVR